jgi:hypothetical protein
MRSHFQTSQPLDSKNIGEETLGKYAIFSFRLREISKELFLDFNYSQKPKKFFKLSL